MYSQTMPRPNRPRDLNALAASIVGEAVQDERPAGTSGGSKTPRDPAAVELGRKGGLKGGKARAKKLTAAQRSAQAKKAAEARWKK